MNIPRKHVHSHTFCSITHILPSMTEAFPDTRIHTHATESQCCRAFKRSVWGCFSLCDSSLSPTLKWRTCISGYSQSLDPGVALQRMWEIQSGSDEFIQSRCSLLQKGRFFFPPCVCVSDCTQDGKAHSANRLIPAACHLIVLYSSACVLAFTYCCCIWQWCQKQLLISQYKLHDCSIPRHWATSTSEGVWLKGFSSSIELWSSRASGWSGTPWVSQSPSSM